MLLWAGDPRRAHRRGWAVRSAERQPAEGIVTGTIGGCLSMRLFFSYSRSDTDFVMRLRQDLERAGHEVWLDQDDIPGGAAWRRSIGEGIAGADVVLVVVTPASMGSPNVERELTVADEQAKRLLPVLAQPAVIPPAMS